MTQDPKDVSAMTFDEWFARNGNSRFHLEDETESDRVWETTKATTKRLRKAVAYYLYEMAKDEPDDKAGLFRATALALIEKPVDNALLLEAAHGRSNDDPLYSNDLGAAPRLHDLWEYHHRVEIDAAERAYDAGSSVCSE